ncbi:MAG: ATP-binding protein [Bryobacterales bacterium]
MTSGAAHEIKNPLNSIALHVEVLKGKLEDADMSLDEISVISREITRLDRVVRSFLDFTRPVELEVHPFDLAGLVGELAGLVRPDAQSQNATVVIEAAPQSAPVRGDRDLLKQAVLNVMINGLQAMPDGGSLTLSLTRTGRDWLLSIRDEGTGIPDELREKIFQLYFTTKGKGSGIGLAMTFRVVQLHGGTIDFVSEEEGAEFRLQIPALEALPEPASAPPRRRGRIRRFVRSRAMTSLRARKPGPSGAQLLLLAAVVATFALGVGCGGRRADAAPAPPPAPVPHAAPNLNPPPGPLSEPQTRAQLPAPQAVPEGAAPPTKGPFAYEAPEVAEAPPAPKPAPAPTRPPVETPAPTPAPTTETPEPAPVPALGPLISDQQRLAYLREIDRNLEQASAALNALMGRRLSADQSEGVRRIREFMRQAREARSGDVALARTLADRARLLAEDLVRNTR